MKIIENFLNKKIHIGLSSLGLSNKKQRNIYKNNYSKIMFKIDIICPVENPLYLIDQTPDHLS